MNKNKISLYLLVTVVILLFIYGAYNYLGNFVNSSFFVGVITLLVGGIAIYLYGIQKKDAKIDAAKIILQEIRRAEDVIFKYKAQGNFQFTQKIIANNSWGKNIHYFVNNLSQDELDKISNLYSTGEFLDKVIFDIYKWRFEYESNKFYEKIPRQKVVVSQNPTDPSSPTQIIEVDKPMQPFWLPILKEIVGKYEPIYHSTTVEPLKKIANLK